MPLERKLNAREIIGTMKMMSARPEFYSGRGAMTCDLDSERLEYIYEHVKKEHGEEAGENFVQMVADLPVLSATDFLITLYKLDSHDWKWDKKLLGNEKGIDVGPDYGSGRREAISMLTIANFLGGSSETDETTICIRGQFLRKHGLPSDKIGLWSYVF